MKKIILYIFVNLFVCVGCSKCDSNGTIVDSQKCKAESKMDSLMVDFFEEQRSVSTMNTGAILIEWTGLSFPDYRYILVDVVDNEKPVMICKYGDTIQISEKWLKFVNNVGNSFLCLIENHKMISMVTRKNGQKFDAKLIRLFSNSDSDSLSLLFNMCKLPTNYVPQATTH